MKEPKKTDKHFFEDGAINPAFIAENIAKHNAKKNIGAHNIFLGQVRQDIIEGKVVKAIEYSAYTEMAEKELDRIREDVITRYKLSCAHVYHSLGTVSAGEISLFVLVSSVHRKAAFDACADIVELIKKDVPIFGKEIFEDGSHIWKENHD